MPHQIQTNGKASQLMKSLLAALTLLECHEDHHPHLSSLISTSHMTAGEDWLYCVVVHIMCSYCKVYDGYYFQKAE